MTDKNNHIGFWNRYARLYDFEIDKFNNTAYQQMYQLMSATLLPDMNVLEVATGTGLVAINIAAKVRRIEATDYSPKMIEAAKKKKCPTNVRFSVEDATALSFDDNSFDAAVISNALHIMPEPAMALSNIARVLKPNGLLIAPTFSHECRKESDKSLNAKILRFIGFETYSRWRPDEYVAFIEENGFHVERWLVLNAAFPLVYLEARNG